MPGEAIVTIRDRQWTVSLATTPAELSQGLGGVVSIPAGTGMLFDVGVDQVIGVTTEPMLFAIDIIWIHSTQGVVEVARDVGPGYLVTPTAQARYFLEVNAGEAEGVEAGDSVEIGITTPGTSLATVIMGIAAPFLVIGVLGAMAKGLGGAVGGRGGTEVKPAGWIAGQKELIRQRRYGLPRKAGTLARSFYTIESDPTMVDFWNEHMEPLAKEFAGGRLAEEERYIYGDANLAFRLENAGDAIREVKGNGAIDYIVEKVGRVERSLSDREWRMPISPQAKAVVEELKRGINEMDMGGPLSRLTKGFYLAVAERDLPAIRVSAGKVRGFLECYEEEEWLEENQGFRSQRTPIGALRKAKEVAEDIEELIKDIFFTQERVSCASCLRYQRIESLVNPGTLTPIQQENLAAARRLAPELTRRRTEVRVAHFDEPNIIGATDGIVVYISPQRLSKRASMLNTVAHESAHILTGKDDSSPVFHKKVADLTAHTLKYLQLEPDDKEQLVREYGVWAASLAEAMVPPGDVARARAVAGRLVAGLYT